MLNIYRGNRAEWLAKLLGEQLRITPPSPLEKLNIIVNSQTTGNWLSEQLSLVTGISAQIAFPFPGFFLNQLARNIIIGKEIKNNPWRASCLVWEILELWPKLIDSNSSESLKTWLDESLTSEGDLTKDKWSLARIIADSFDDYSLYRPEILERWKTNNKRSKNYIKDDWQQFLFRMLLEKTNEDPFCLNVKKAIEKLRKGDVDKDKLPRQIYIYGISSLAPIQIELLQALSAIIDIKIFLLTPCPTLWKRSKTRREVLGDNWFNPPDESWLISAPRLEALLGRTGSEFQLLLEGSGEYQFGERDEDNLFYAPATIAKNLNRKPNLLEQIQEQLIIEDNNISISRDFEDDSLLFYACPGFERQVQIVRDQILQWLAKNEKLELKDILIITPQLKKFSPYVKSIFSDKSTTGIELPIKIIDNNNNIPGIIQFIINLLELSENKFDAGVLDNMLSNQALQSQSGITQIDAINISQLLQQTGFRWGLDSSEKTEEETHTFLWSLDRWLLGLVYPKDENIILHNIAPYHKGITINELLKYWPILDKIYKSIKEVRQLHNCNEWVVLIKSIMERFFKDGGIWEEEKNSLLYYLEEFRAQSESYKGKLSGAIILDILKEKTLSKINHHSFGSGQITLSTFESIKSIPYKVIVLLGVDSSIFPRNDNRPYFNLLEQKRVLGDPRKHDIDRFTILEALMSARENLLITWNCRDERTGEELPAASPILQWIDQIKSELGTNNISSLLRIPPPNSLSRNNFVENKNIPPISCDKKSLKIRNLLDKKEEFKANGLALPLYWPKNIESDSKLDSIETLRSWLISPQKKWLNELGIKQDDWQATISSDEDYELSELSRYKIIKEIVDDIDHFTSNRIEEQNKIDIKNIYNGTGFLPPFSAGEIELDLLRKRLFSIRQLLNKLGVIETIKICYGDREEEIIKTETYKVIIEPGYLKAKVILSAWLSHLITCAVNSIPNKGTIVIARKRDQVRSNSYHIPIGWKAIDKDQAIKEIENLSNIAIYGLINCWPVPVESGYEYAKNVYLDKEKAFLMFRNKWEGGYKITGEKTNQTMKICFGNDASSSLFTENENFHEYIMMIYDFLLKNQYKKEEIKIMI